MDIKKCPKCKEDVREDAKKCKHCGSDLRNWFIRHKILTVLLVFFLIGIIGASFGKTPSKSVDSGQELEVSNVRETKVPEIVKVSARDLFLAYKKNEIAADQQYKDKTLEVSGKISNISEMLGIMNVVLDTGDFITSVQCMMSESQRDTVATLNKGQFVTLQGQNTGMSLNIALKDCVLK